MRSIPAILLPVALAVGCSAPVTPAGAPSYSSPAAVPAPTGPATTVSDGTYEVGPDMVAGSYRTPGPGSHGPLDFCYWERTKDDSGQLEAIIANDNIKGPGSVTVKHGEFFKVSGGCSWTKK